MKRLIFLVFTFLVLNPLVSIAGKQQQATKNIVLILADDMGFHMSGTGTPGIQTPHLDCLAEKGTLLTNAFSVCSSCSPSRSSILTGMYPHANGHWRNTFGPGLSDPEKEFTRASEQADIVGVHEWVQTLPEIMNEAGYYTAIMKKFHLSYPWKYPFSGRYPTKSTPDAYRADIRKIIEDAGEKPFFIQANITSPHRPLKPFAQKYQGTWPDKEELELFPWLPDLDSVRQDLLYYYVSVIFTDQLTGRILEALRASGKGEETLIIFTSDHGPPFHRAKASAYYAAAHVPLIISGKGLPEGQVNDELVSLIDLLPWRKTGLPGNCMI
jgi:N-sulfoglucosamine sulfohydrolase